MATWRNAKALDKLRAQINAIEPTRDKTSDGTIGDAAHAATKSEHNPNKWGVVTAFDCTHDPIDGVDCNVLCKALVASRDQRILYIIWNKQMYRSYPKTGTVPWQPSAYTGPNPHDHHLHISLIDDDDGVDALYDDERPWALPADLSYNDFNAIPFGTVKYGDVGPAVVWVRERLRAYGFELPTSDVFSATVKAAVAKFQHDHGLVPDGIVGRLTREALRAAPAPAAGEPLRPVPNPTPPPQPAPTGLPNPIEVAVGAVGVGAVLWKFLGWVGVGTVVAVAIVLLVLWLRHRSKRNS